jgi:hypothetical protein
VQRRGNLADSDPRLQSKPFIYRGFIGVRGLSFTGIFTCLAARSETGHCTVNARSLLANATDADAGTLITMSETMKQAFGLVRRPWGVFYLKNKITGEQKSLKTSDKHEAQRILQAHNESESQPHFNLSLARVYLNGADPKLATRTWQEVMENIVAKKTDETRRRWEVAIKDRNFDCIRNLRVAETRPEHFDRALVDGKVSTNVYLRRIHNPRPGHGMAVEIGHPAPAIAQAGIQTEAGNHGGRTRGHSSSRAECGAAGFLRTAVAYGGVANGRGLPAGGGCGLE